MVGSEENIKPIAPDLREELPLKTKKVIRLSWALFGSLA
jgi:hypothetical protein